jgi:hypothetical protein
MSLANSVMLQGQTCVAARTLHATPWPPLSRHSPISLSTIFAALAVGGCSQALQPTVEGHGGDPGAEQLREARVTWNRYGEIDGRWGIEGAWFSYSDCSTEGAGLGFPCTRLDRELVGPDGSEGWATSASQVCMKGTVPRIESGNTLALDYQWGAGIGFSLGEPYDATAHNVIGFMFDVTQGAPGKPAPATLNIGLAMPATVGVPHIIAIPLPSLDRRVMFDEVEQGEWVAAPTQFRPEAISTVGFDVYTNNQAPKDYHFCVSNFRVLCAGECIP